MYSLTEPYDNGMVENMRQLTLKVVHSSGAGQPAKSCRVMVSRFSKIYYIVYRGSILTNESRRVEIIPLQSPIIPRGNTTGSQQICYIYYESRCEAIRTVPVISPNVPREITIGSLFYSYAIQLM
jgi:hypothetical protein